jgi:hypothetical protein
MRKLSAYIFIAALGLSGSVATQAAADAAPIDRSMIIQVAGGCGHGWHRGPHGGCRRNYAPGVRHACPRGYHLGPRGRCIGNRY